MITFTLFAISGVGIVIITLAKRREEKKKTTVLILRLISLGDERLRKLHHESLRQYSYGKEKFGFWVKKQLPLKIKSFWNRLSAQVRDKSVEYLGDMRGSRLLKRPDGISEFFKNISEIEKGGGEINETLHHGEIDDDFYIQTSEERHAAAVKEMEAMTVVVAVETKPAAHFKHKSPKPRSSRKKAAARSRKSLTEVLD